MFPVSQGFRPPRDLAPLGPNPQESRPPRGQISWDLALPARPPLRISPPPPSQ